jgi:hypothetical protein
VILHEHLGRLSPRERLYSFLESRYRIAAFSSASSAYKRLSFALSASSSFIRLSSETLTPPYFARQFEVGRAANPVLPGQLAERDAGFALFEDRDDL